MNGATDVVPLADYRQEFAREKIVPAAREEVKMRIDDRLADLSEPLCVNFR